mgnify:CR=1 FL=1
MNRKNFFGCFVTILLVHLINLSAQTATLEATLDLRDINGNKVPYQNNIPLPTFEKQKSRVIIDLAGQWKKERFSANDNLSLLKRVPSTISLIENEAAGRHLSGYNDSAWETKLLPGVENKLNAANVTPEFYNDGIWYRRKFDIGASHNGKFIKLIFYSVNYTCDVWINGNYAGYHEGGYTPFAFDISSFLNYGGENVIAVRVDNIAWNARKDIVPYTTPDWFNYAGIIHDVYLEISDPISIARADIVTEGLNGGFNTSVLIQNMESNNKDVTVTLNVYEAMMNESNVQSEFAEDLIGNEVSINGETQKEINVPSQNVYIWKTYLQISNPKFWSLKSPNLYILKVTVKKGSEVIDQYYTQFGLRTISISNGRFLLNNRIWFLVGLARHEEHPDYGRSVPKEIIFSDLETVQDFRALYLRTAHYPNHPYTYLIADRIGLAIMEEIPVYWFDTAETWIIQNTQRKIHLQMFREMVFRDFNRPSIIMWSASNECLDVPNRKVFHEMLASDRLGYNDGRILTQSAAADRPGPNDDSQNPLDVAGWTMYFGIFHKYILPQPKLDEAFGGTFSFLNNAKNNFPSKPIIATEFGYWSSENNSTITNQTYIFDETFRAFKFHAPYNEAGNIQSYGNLIGVTWWALFDWYQYRTGGWQTMGLVSMDRKTSKPVANSLKSSYLPFFSKEGILVNVNSEDENIPGQMKLEQNFPNPFNPSTTINFAITVRSLYSLKIYDMLGREVALLFNRELMPGNHKINFDAKKLSSGVYFYKLTGNNNSIVKKMLLVK